MIKHKEIHVPHLPLVFLTKQLSQYVIKLQNMDQHQINLILLKE